MPGVVDANQNWDDRDSQLSERGSRTQQRMMSHYHSGNDKISSRSHSNGYSSDPQSDFNDDGATYLLEHLATFSVGSQYGLLTPKDGLRRLLQMEKSSGIWTQKMQMRLERNWVIIIDYENGDVVERFPMNFIVDPTAYTSDDRRELYNNILIFIVREDPKSSHSPPEMHIFQCAQVSAQDVVDEIKLFITGKAKSRYKDNTRHLPPPPVNPPPDPPVNGIAGISVREQVNMFNAAAASITPLYASHRESISPNERTHGAPRSMYARELNDETSSVSSDKYEKDVSVLNHCFDDIERFIARLQHAAAAYKELERRQKNRKNKKKDMGDGMLSIRAKPPPEREFADILQKFKLSFNLLAKLKSHIHDPNAPELVHFLFTPLALIVDAAKDSNYSTNLPSRVVSPLLTRDAIELLTNCCTSKETDLWHSLGEPWTISRDQWKDYEKEYHPVFSDGWAPEYPSFEERGHSEMASASPPQSYQREEGMRERDEEYRSQEEKSGRYDSEFFYGNERHRHRDRSSSPVGVPDRRSRSDYESRHYEHHEEASRRDLSADRDGRFAQGLEREFRDARDRDVRSDFSADSIEHTSNNPDPHKQFEWQQQQWLDELKLQGARIVQVVYPRTANNDKELTVIRGEFLEVLDDSRKWWKAKNMKGQVAHVPHTIVTPYNDNGTEEDIFSNPLYASKGNNREGTYSLNDSPPTKSFEEIGGSGTQEPASRRPPSIPAPTPGSADWVRRERQGKKEDNIDLEDVTDSAGSNYSSGQMEAAYRRIQERLRADTWEQGFETWEVREKSNKPEKKQTTESGHNDPAAEISVKEAQEQLKKEVETKQIKSLGGKGQKKWVCPEHQKADCSFLKLNSNASHTSHWLEVKGFSETARAILDSMTGEMLFSLSKEQMEKYLGEEGSRLYSHLTVQRNICGVKTTRSKELKSILEQRRRLTDEASALIARRNDSLADQLKKERTIDDEFSQIDFN